MKRELIDRMEQRMGCVERGLQCVEHDIQRLDDLRKADLEHVIGLMGKNHDLMELQVSRLRHEREITTGAQAEAINKAEAATEKRFESFNAFRAQLSDQATTFLPREVAEAQLAEIRKQINTIVDRQNFGRGVKSGVGEFRDHAVSNMNLIIATLSVIVTILIANNTI